MGAEHATPSIVGIECLTDLETEGRRIGHPAQAVLVCLLVPVAVIHDDAARGRSTVIWVPLPSVLATVA